jgi:hypothetical protein
MSIELGEDVKVRWDEAVAAHHPISAEARGCALNKLPRDPRVERDSKMKIKCLSLSVH